MEHMKPEILQYIKSRVTSSEVITTGDIETVYTSTFDNGMVLSGKSLRPIEGFQQEEAQEAAYEDAISKIYDGVAFTLNKL